MSAHLMAARSTILPHSGFGAAVVARVKTIVKALVNRRQIRELHALDDRLLKDIGLVRSDVVAALDIGLHEDPSLHLRRVAAGRARTR